MSLPRFLHQSLFHFSYNFKHESTDNYTCSKHCICHPNRTLPCHCLWRSNCIHHTQWQQKANRQRSPRGIFCKCHNTDNRPCNSASKRFHYSASPARHYHAHHCSLLRTLFKLFRVQNYLRAKRARKKDNPPANINCRCRVLVHNHKLPDGSRIKRYTNRIQKSPHDLRRTGPFFFSLLLLRDSFGLSQITKNYFSSCFLCHGPRGAFSFM